MISSYLSSLLLASLLLPISSFAEPTDLSMGKAMDPLSAEMIFAAQRSYEKRSSKAAYVVAKTISAYLGAQTNPQIPREHIPAIVSGAREQAALEVNGNSFRGGAVEALTKDAAGLLTGQKLSNFTGFLVEKSANAISTPGKDPALANDYVGRLNAYALKKLGEDGILGKELGETVKEYFPELNETQSLEDEQGVKRERREQKRDRIEEENRKSFAKLLGKLRAEPGNGKLTQEELDQLIKDKMKEGFGLANLEFLRIDLQDADTPPASDQQAIDLEARQNLEKKADDFRSMAGSLAAFATYSGNPAAAVVINKAGVAISSALDAVAAYYTFGADPVGSARAFMGAGAAFAGIFGEDQADPNALRHQEIMEQLTSLKEMVWRLSESMDRRFSRLDDSIRNLNHQSNERFSRIDFSLRNVEANQQFFIAALRQLDQQTFASYMLSGGLEWVRSKHNCLQAGARKQLSNDDLRLCRDELAVLSLYGPSREEGGIITAGPEILDSVAQRLAKRMSLDELSELPIKPKLKSINLAAWLIGTDQLLKLKRTQPAFAALLKEEEPDQTTGFVTVPDLIRVGQYYQAFMRRMGVRKDRDGTSRLRADVVESYLTDYANAVAKIFDFGSDATRGILRGAPPTNLPANLLSPPADPAQYRFLSEGTPLCDKGSTFTNIDRRRDAAPRVTDQSGEYAATSALVHWPRAAIEMIPPTIRFAVTSAFSDDDQSGLKLQFCLAKGEVKEWRHTTPPESPKKYVDEEFTAMGTVPMHWWRWASANLEFKLRAVYRKGSVVKSLDLASVKTEQWYSGENRVPAPGRNPIDPFWIAPTGADGALSSASVWKDPTKINMTLLPGASELDADYNEVLSAARRMASEKIAEQLTAQNAATQIARESLAFVLERGIANHSSGVNALLGSIANPATLPNAEEWARFQFESGFDNAQMMVHLKLRMDALRTLVSKVAEEKNLQAADDLFESRLKELTESPAPKGRPELISKVKQSRSVKR